MQTTDGINLKIFCDGCGNQVNLELSDFYIDMSYGCEDECYGCPDDEYKLSMEYPEHWSKLRSYLAQQKFEFCNECRCNNNYAKEFENAARASRVILIRKLIDSKVLPGFRQFDTSKAEKLEAQLIELETAKEQAVEKIIELATNGSNVADNALLAASKELAFIDEKINCVCTSLELLDEL